ncbi:DinB family protein [Achromobacter spanius]|uniref:DinB family protein n=1 Tax=Achromobacter spanius TaxID=217203 RepID=UPI00381C0F3E
MKSILNQLFGYQAWAHQEFMVAISTLDKKAHPATYERVTRLMNHCLVVNQIFMAHLSNREHSYDSSNTTAIPDLPILASNLRDADQWYESYVETVGPEQLAEPISFRFTDGKQGKMTRGEMLMHVITHGGYHRGEVGRLLTLAQPGIDIPWDTFAVYLHGQEPDRRITN